MSDQDVGKRMAEEMELQPFLEAYEWVTKEELTEGSSEEHPDFICIRENEEEVGIELTKVMRDPRDAQWERILERIDEMDPHDALATIFERIKEKETLRAKHYSRHVKETILVLQTVECPLDAMEFALVKVQNDFLSYGFSEIWLADYTGLEAYGDIELFGLFPEKWWGYHERWNPNRKPYG